jgi:uncharacterized membrane protein YhhN
MVLVYAEHAHAKALRAISKTIASLAFVAVALLATDTWSAYSTWIVSGLVLGVAGDIALLGKRDAAFMAGLGAFLLGHISYIVACAQLVHPRDWLEPSPIYAVPIAVGGTALVYLWPRLGTMKVPVIGYVLAIVTMMIGAIAVGYSSAMPEANRQLLVAGAALFFASDLAVARDKFVAQSFTNRAWGLPAYYAGQLLIAWSLH